MSRVVTVGARLPDVRIEAAPGGVPVPLRRSGRQATVVVVIHGSDCESCRRYLADLQAHEAAIRDWDGRVLVVLGEELGAAERLRAELALGFAVLADPARTLAEGDGLEAGTLLIADQWGEIFHVESTGSAAHTFSSPEEVAEWLRYVTIQCPECQGEAR